MKILTISPNPLLNLLAPCALNTGKSTRIPAFTVSAEGKGVNVAKVLVRHGYEAMTAFFSGGHSGAWFADLLLQQGVKSVIVPVKAPMRLGFLAPGDPATAMLEDGFAVTAAEVETFFRMLDDLLPQVGMVIASGAVPDRSMLDFYPRLVERCHRACVPCWCDTYGAPMAALLASGLSIDLAKPNRQEFASASGWERIAELHLTDGAAGVSIQRYGQETHRLTPPLVQEVNATGSGDSYVAGLAHARLQGWPFERQLAYAAACGAANARTLAVAEIDPAEALALMDQATIQTL